VSHRGSQGCNAKVRAHDVIGASVNVQHSKTGNGDTNGRQRDDRREQLGNKQWSCHAATQDELDIPGGASAGRN
jgi:hypothetical protein